MHLQQSGRVRAGCSPSGQGEQRTAEQSDGWPCPWPWPDTQRQQSGGLSAGVWPSGQAAQRTAEQSVCAPAGGVAAGAAGAVVVAGWEEVPGAMVALLDRVEEQAQR